MGHLVCFFKLNYNSHIINFILLKHSSVVFSIFFFLVFSIYTELCNYTIWSQNTFIASKRTLYLLVVTLKPPSFQTPATSKPSCLMDLFQILHINGIVECVTCSVWLLLLLSMFLRFILVAWISISFLFKADDIPWCRYIIFIHSSSVHIWVVSTLGLLWTLMLLVYEHLYTFIHKFLCGHMFSFLLGLYLAVELLGHVVSLCFFF